MVANHKGPPLLDGSWIKGIHQENWCARQWTSSEKTLLLGLKHKIPPKCLQIVPTFEGLDELQGGCQRGIRHGQLRDNGSVGCGACSQKVANVGMSHAAQEIDFRLKLFYKFLILRLTRRLAD